MIILLSILLLGSSQPILMVISLIMITLIYSLYIYMIMGSYWFSYILLLIMLSGVLVVFSYMASLIPNESFEIYLLIFIMLLMFMFSYKKISFSMFMGEYLSLSIWISNMSVLMMLLVSFLFMLMLMVVWISCKNEGSLRCN